MNVHVRSVSLSRASVCSSVGAGLAAFVLAVSSPNVAHADVRSFSTENEWSSTQLNALGGVGHLSEELADQFFADPSLPQLRKTKLDIELGSAHLMYSTDLKETVQDAREFQSGSSGSQGASQTVDLLDKVHTLFGRNLMGGANFTLLAVRRGGVTVVPYTSMFFDGGADVPAWPRASGTGDLYGGVGIGYGFMVGKDWDLGLNIRPGVRAYAKGAADVSSVGDFAGSSSTADSSPEGTSDFGSYGVGLYVPVDLGTGYRFTKDTRVNLVARNVGSAKSLQTIKGEAPPVYPMRLSLGLSSHLLEKGAHSVNAGTDVQDLMNVSEKNGLWYRWQWGAQYLYRLSNRKETSFGLNGGLRSGYPAIGLFLDLYILKFEAAYFVRESGYYVGQRPVKAVSFRTWTQMTF